MFLRNLLTDLVWTKANNATVWDDRGKSYIDFTCGIFAANIGHDNPYVTEAIKASASLIHTYTFRNYARENYLDRLCRFTGFEAAALFSAGTEATEAAWKCARQYTGKHGIYGLHHAFHGKTYGALIMASKEGSPHYSQDIKKTGMLIMEPYTAHTAAFHTDKTLNRIRGLVTNGKLLLVLDEIQGGFGRTGKLFGFEHYDNLDPDLVCIGKGMGNGFPVSGLLGPKKILDEPVMDLSSTHGGNPLACSVGLGVINYMEDHNVIAEAERKGEIFHRTLAEFPVVTAGKGLLGALWFDTVGRADNFVRLAAEYGILVVHTGRETVKLAPPLTIPDAQLQTGLDMLKRAATKVMEAKP
jgi:acetylornithine/succinyldiaminopimelate/putrescine aminotransferase